MIRCPECGGYYFRILHDGFEGARLMCISKPEPGYLIGVGDYRCGIEWDEKIDFRDAINNMMELLHDQERAKESTQESEPIRPDIS
jgi:hypothetical protein